VFTDPGPTYSGSPRIIGEAPFVRLELDVLIASTSSPPW